MGTYNLTKGDTRPAAIDFGKIFVARIPIVVTEIIAANATLTANAKITASDVIQLWDIPVPVALLPGLASFKIVAPGTASNRANIGIGGSTEMWSAVALDSAAGTCTYVAHNATWGTDNYGSYTVTTTDTIDMTFVADEVTGSFVIFLPGYMLD